MNEHSALLAFGALSQETRLRVLRTLVVAGSDGMAAGRLAQLVGVSPSNLSFHLKELEHSALVAVTRHSRSLVYRARFEVLATLVIFLVKDCCSGHPDVVAAISPTLTGTDVPILTE